MFNGFTASVFTKKVRCNQADNVINTNNKAFKIEKRKRVREYKHKLVGFKSSRRDEIQGVQRIC